MIIATQKSGNVVSELLDRLSLCTAQHVRLSLQKALVIFLELLLDGEFLLPFVGQLPRHEAMFGLDRAIMLRGPLENVVNVSRREGCGKFEDELEMIERQCFFRDDGITWPRRTD